MFIPTNSIGKYRLEVTAGITATLGTNATLVYRFRILFPLGSIFFLLACYYKIIKPTLLKRDMVVTQGSEWASTESLRLYRFTFCQSWSLFSAIKHWKALAILITEVITSFYCNNTKNINSKPAEGSAHYTASIFKYAQSSFFLPLKIQVHSTVLSCYNWLTTIPVNLTASAPLKKLYKSVCCWWRVPVMVTANLQLTQQLPMHLWPMTHKAVSQVGPLLFLMGSVRKMYPNVFTHMYVQEGLRGLMTWSQPAQSLWLVRMPEVQ